jgi:hypothetical protein
MRLSSRSVLFIVTLCNLNPPNFINSSGKLRKRVVSKRLCIKVKGLQIRKHKLTKGQRNCDTLSFREEFLSYIFCYPFMFHTHFKALIV